MNQEYILRDYITQDLILSSLEKQTSNFPLRYNLYPFSHSNIPFNLNEISSNNSTVLLKDSQ